MNSYLVHSAKDTSLSNHKQIKVENGKYLYKDPAKANSNNDSEESNKEEDKLALEREKLENEVAIKNLKEKLEPEKTEEEIAAEQEAKEKVARAQNYISSFNATYKNTPASKIPPERLAKYRENMAVVMSNSKKEQK